MFVISSSGFASSNTKSARLPAATVPSESVSRSAFAGLIVALCNAASGVTPSAT